MKDFNSTSNFSLRSNSLLLMRLVTSLLFFITHSIYGQTALDPTFGTGGKVVTNLAQYEYSSSVTTQPDGKVLVGVDNYAKKFGVLRYNSNGSIDNTFGTLGVATFDFSMPSDAKNNESKIILQADGKIILIGRVGFDSRTYQSSDFAIARLNPNGTIDNTFGTNGKVIIDITTNQQDIAFDAVLQSDGKIVVGGITNAIFSTDVRKFSLVRLNTNGSIDNTFGTNGKVITGVNSFDISGTTLKIQNDGKILFSGSISSNTSSNNYVIARYLSNGTLDNTFGTNGIVSVKNLNSNFLAGIFPNMILLADGKIILGGLGFLVSNQRLGACLIKFNPNGSLDNGFGNNGFVVDTSVLRIDTIFIDTEIPMPMTLQSDGKIVMGLGSERKIKLVPRALNN